MNGSGFERLMVFRNWFLREGGSGMASGIYLIRNTQNGKVYVGSSADTTNRIRGHKCQLRKGSHTSRHLQAAWNKYGEDAFVFTVKRECEVADLLVIEQQYIDLFLSADADCGYNICEVAGRPPSRKGVPKSEETKRRMSEAAKRRSPEHRRRQSESHRGPNSAMFGKRHSPEMIELFRQKSTGKKHSAETKEKMRQWNLQNNPRKGVTLSADERLQKSQATARFAMPQVEEMRAMRAAGSFWREIATRFECSQSCARRVVNGERLAYSTGAKQ